MTGVRKTRSTSAASTPPLVTATLDESNILDQLQANLHSPTQFTNVYNQCYQITTLRSSFTECLCTILANSANVDNKILQFILDSFITNHADLLVKLNDLLFKQDVLPFIKRTLSSNEDNKDLLLVTLRFLVVFIDNYSHLLSASLAECLSSVLHFIVTHISSSTYLIYGDLVIDLLWKIVKRFTPLPKEIVDVLGRSPSSIISTHFLTDLKSWVKHVDDTKLALFAIHLWEPLAALLSRLLTRGHTKGNEMLAVMQDAFVVANYSIRGAAFTAWASFMSHIYRSDLNLHNNDVHQQQLYNRLLKLFLTPFLPDYTSKSKTASIAKCRAWFVLVSAYPTHIDDVILPFFSFAFGNHMSSKMNTTWWLECRKIGAQCLHDLLHDNKHNESMIKLAGDQILNYLFDSIIDDLLENTVNEDKSSGLTNWNAYLTCLTHMFISNNAISDSQRVAINTCLLTRMEQLWIDSRFSTQFLLKLFDTFEQMNFPLAIETVLRDSSIRTKTLSASQTNPSQDKSSSPDQTTSNRTTLSDQYLHMMLEHAIRLDDPTVEDSYLHVVSYLIDTLSKTSDDNFCQQTRSLLIKCSVELSVQPLRIPLLFWHIWLRCSTHLINILNRTRSMELNNQRQETTIDLLLRPFSFGDSKLIDYSYTLIWTQLFKALCRLIVLDGKPLLDLYHEFFRCGPVLHQAINEQTNQRLFGFSLTTVKCLLKNFQDIDLVSTSKRSLSSLLFCYAQLSIIINIILKRLLLNDENNIQWLLVFQCLLKSHKISTNEQSKSIVFTYVRDLIVDLFNSCKTCSQLETILTNLTHIVQFLNAYELIGIATPTLGSSPISINKQQQSDNVILNKIILTLHSVFESSNSSSLLQLIYPLLIVAFQHNKAVVRNKARKCWNETFGHLTFIVYPNELRTCLRDLKDKEHLLLPCFLDDHDNSIITGSGLLPSSTDESQLSQQVDIVTPIICSTKTLPQSSSANINSPCLTTVRSSNSESIETLSVPVATNVNHDNQSDTPVIIPKRMSSATTALTEKQKEKLRTRHAIPLLCDDNSNTQSLSGTMDTPTIENMMTNYQLRNTNTGNTLPFFKPSFSQDNDNNTTIESSTTMNTENDNNTSTLNMDDDVPEESAIAKKLRRSGRPSISARKSLTMNAKKNRSLTSSNEITTTLSSIAIDSSSTVEMTKTRPLKSILKRLSPAKPRQEHTRRVAFHDQVKVLLFASPLRRDIHAQQQKRKSPIRDDLKNVSSITTRRSSLLINTNTNKARSSQLFDFSDDAKPQPFNDSQVSPRKTPAEPIYPALVDCDKPLDSLIHVVFGGVCPSNAINYFHSIKMNTVGDIAKSTAEQIEIYPIPPPKLANIQKALSLYQERLINSPSLSPIIGTNGESLTPIASTSEEPIAISDGTFTKEVSSLPTTVPTAIINDPHNQLYDVDTLIDSFDYERFYLTDNQDIENEIGPTSTSQLEFIRTRLKTTLANRDEQLSPQKRRLSIANKDEEDIDSTEQDEQSSPKKQTIISQTLGDRLQKAASIFKENGYLPFDEDYIEIVRLLFNNPSLTHLEKLHLKSLFLDN